MGQFSTCEKHSEKFGNVINPDTVPDITGNLIKPVDVPAAEVLCTRKNNRRTLNLHVPFLSFYDAQKACDKYSTGTIVGPFRVTLLFKSFKTTSLTILAGP